MAFEKAAYIEAVVGADITAFRRGMADVRNELGILAEKVSGLNKVGRMLTLGLTAPLLVGGTSAINLASEVDKNLKNINSIARLTDAELEKLGDRLRTLSMNTRYSIREVTEAGYQVFSAGVLNVDHAFAITKYATDLAEAGISDLESTTKMLTAVMLNYRDMGVTEKFASDVIANMVAFGVGDMQDATRNMHKVTPIARALNISFEDVGAAIALVSQSTADMSKAQTSLSQIMVNMMRASKHTLSVFGKVGVKTFKELIEKSGGFFEALITLRKATTEEEFLRMFSKTGVEGALALTNNIEQTLARRKEFMNNLENATEIMRAEQMKSFSYSFDMLKAAIEGLADVIGGVLIPVLTPVVHWLTNFIRTIAEAPKPFLRLAVAITAGLGGLAPILWLFGGQITSLGILIKGTAGVIFSKATVFFAWLTPITSIVGALQSLIGVMTALVTVVGGLAVLQVAKRLFENLVEPIKAVIAVFDSFIAKVKETNLFKDLKLNFTTKLGDIPLTEAKNYGKAIDRSLREFDLSNEKYITTIWDIWANRKKLLPKDLAELSWEAFKKRNISFKNGIFSIRDFTPPDISEQEKLLYGYVQKAEEAMALKRDWAVELPFGIKLTSSSVEEINAVVNFVKEKIQNFIKAIDSILKDAGIPIKDYVDTVVKNFNLLVDTLYFFANEAISFIVPLFNSLSTNIDFRSFLVKILKDVDLVINQLFVSFDAIVNSLVKIMFDIHDLISGILTGSDLKTTLTTFFDNLFNDLHNLIERGIIDFIIAPLKIIDELFDTDLHSKVKIFFDDLFQSKPFVLFRNVVISVVGAVADLVVYLKDELPRAFEATVKEFDKNWASWSKFFLLALGIGSVVASLGGLYNILIHILPAIKAVISPLSAFAMVAAGLAVTIVYLVNQFYEGGFAKMLEDASVALDNLAGIIAILVKQLLKDFESRIETAKVAFSQLVIIVDKVGGKIFNDLKKAFEDIKTKIENFANAITAFVQSEELSTWLDNTKNALQGWIDLLLIFAATLISTKIVFLITAFATSLKALGAAGATASILTALGTAISSLGAVISGAIATVTAFLTPLRLAAGAAAALSLAIVGVANAFYVGGFHQMVLDAAQAVLMLVDSIGLLSANLAALTLNINPDLLKEARQAAKNFDPDVLFEDFKKQANAGIFSDFVARAAMATLGNYKQDFSSDIKHIFGGFEFEYGNTKEAREALEAQRQSLQGIADITPSLAASTPVLNSLAIATEDLQEKIKELPLSAEAASTTMVASLNSVTSAAQTLASALSDIEMKLASINSGTAALGTTNVTNITVNTAASSGEVFREMRRRGMHNRER